MKLTTLGLKLILLYAALALVLILIDSWMYFNAEQHLPLGYHLPIQNLMGGIESAVVFFLIFCAHTLIFHRQPKSSIKIQLS
jgi:uncharacterized membrane protein